MGEGPNYSPTIFPQSTLQVMIGESVLDTIDRVSTSGPMVVERKRARTTMGEIR